MPKCAAADSSQLINRSLFFIVLPQRTWNTFPKSSPGSCPVVYMEPTDERAAATRPLSDPFIKRELIVSDGRKELTLWNLPSWDGFSSITTQGISLPETGHTIPEQRRAMLISRQVHRDAGISFHCHHQILNIINITPIFQMRTVCPGVHSIWGEGLK